MNNNIDIDINKINKNINNYGLLSVIALVIILLWRAKYYYNGYDFTSRTPIHFFIGKIKNKNWLLLIKAWRSNIMILYDCDYEDHINDDQKNWCNNYFILLLLSFFSFLFIFFYININTNDIKSIIFYCHNNCYDHDNEILDDFRYEKNSTNFL